MAVARDAARPGPQLAPAIPPKAPTVQLEALTLYSLSAEIARWQLIRMALDLEPMDPQDLRTETR